MNDAEGPGDPQPQGERDDRPELDIDSAFAAIIADFATPTPHGVGPWPAAEDLDDPDDGPTDDAGTPGPASGLATTGDGGVGRDAGPAAITSSDRWDPPARRIAIPGNGAARLEPGDGPPPARDEEDEEGYEPPEPPPFPRGDLVSRAAWVAVVGGPVFLLLAAMLWRSLPTFLLLLALTAFVGGFITLVARMPQEHPDDPDDGAVV